MIQDDDQFIRHTKAFDNDKPEEFWKQRKFQVSSLAAVVLTLAGLYATGYSAGQTKLEERLDADQSLFPKFESLDEFNKWGDQRTDEFFHNGVDMFMPQEALRTLKENNFIAIRHAESFNNRLLGMTHIVSEEVLGTTNEEIQLKLGLTGKDLTKMQANTFQRDSVLSRRGIKQSEEAQQLSNQLNITRVYIAPSRRCVETAYHMFKAHPNFEQMQFILAPQLRETLLGSGCMPLDVFDFLSFSKDYFPNLDISAMEKSTYPELWWLSDMRKDDIDFMSELLADYNGFTYDPKTELFYYKDTGKLVQPRSLKTGPSEGTQIEFFQPYMEFFVENGFGWTNELDNSWETADDLWYQTQQFNDVLRQDVPHLFGNENREEHDEQVALVTHLITAQAIVTDWSDYDMGNTDGPVPFPEDKIFFENAQLVGMDQYMF